MKKTSPIIFLVMLVLGVSSTASAQRSNSSCQTITFGVTRSTQALLNSIISAPQNSAGSLHQQALSSTKITISSGRSPDKTQVEHAGATQGRELSPTTLNSVAKTAQSPIDLQSFIPSAKSLPMESTSLVITVTN